MNQLYMALIGDHNDHGLNGGPAIFNALGTGLDGGYEEYVKVREDLLVPVVC
jgi:threonine dehydrogenase-like Zn-dependent dehydrogenase